MRSLTNRAPLLVLLGSLLMPLANAWADAALDASLAGPQRIDRIRGPPALS